MVKFVKKEQDLFWAKKKSKQCYVEVYKPNGFRIIPMVDAYFSLKGIVGRLYIDWLVFSKNWSDWSVGVGSIKYWNDILAKYDSFKVVFFCIYTKNISKRSVFDTTVEYLECYKYDPQVEFRDFIEKIIEEGSFVLKGFKKVFSYANLEGDIRYWFLR